MKITLPEKSLVIKDRLEMIVKEIVACQKDKIAMIILFGSYARGDWVSDEYVEGGVTYNYQSDIDLLLVLRKNKYSGYISLRMQKEIKNRLKRNLLSNALVRKEPWVSLILEPIGRINSDLEKSKYFFSDIKREGVLLYDNGEFELSDIGELSNEERGEVAKEDYNHWFNKGGKFLSGTKFYYDNCSWNEAAFLLHQATESFYNASILVFTGYKDKIHDIEKLGSIAGSQSVDLGRVFYLNTKENEESFDLLKRAYIEARYSKNYKISKEQLEYLVERIEKLKEVTKEVCLERIRGYGEGKNS